MYNTINANYRHYLHIKYDENPSNMRDRIELILVHGAIVYE